jgi:hypothetical protein
VESLNNIKIKDAHTIIFIDAWGWPFLFVINALFNLKRAWTLFLKCP